MIFNIGKEKIRVFRHPLFYVTEEVKSWYEEYSISEHTKKISSESINPLYVDSMRIYERYKRETEMFVRDRK